ncbi:uncharacterized protein BDZ99DRAFT_465512 [Mytilinidion resinicola]|uniref:Golgi apparatus membrane protein TVP38 n=1 Tax=Mytilinidion resinicola TaxID=574789 RepID=A0A6A6YDT5_9PEZI|nr:uncharacterized protein BDZ99DRAFT_465512 [Mytilinidion resinicola]KAF2806718.1 hypothetical protein BDZ99DRAFT_465512 [Mytilinidion resinicola]
MPADDYDARALALPIDEPPPSPAWTRRSASFRRNDSPYSVSTRPPTFLAKVRKNGEKLHRRAMQSYNKLSPVQRVLVSVSGVVAIVLGILFLVYNERIFGVLAPWAKKWRNVRAGWLILWSMIFVVSFPPLIGYSSLLTIAGFVYGFPNGWFIAASATIVGSTVSFILSRSLLKDWVHRLIANDKRFAALALTLKHDGLKLLIMIRLCPLPYSLSNGAIATFPTVHWASFAAATTIVSPKLMLHIFIGAQLDKIAESGGKMEPKTKAISYISILIGAVAGIVTGWFMYSKTKQRAAELEAEERAGVRRASIEDLENEYADDPDALEAAEILREEDDDISLRPAEYHDDLSDTDPDDDPDDVFMRGHEDEEEAVVGRK